MAIRLFAAGRIRWARRYSRAVKKSATAWLDQLASENESLAHRARLKLGGLHAEDAWMIDDLLLALESRERTKRFWALTGMAGLARRGALGKRAASAVQALVVVARTDKAFGNRQSAIGALGRCKAQAKTGVPVLLAALASDRSEFVRAEAARALVALGRAATDAAAPALVSALRDKAQDVAWAAAVALKFVPLPASTHAAIRRAATAAHVDGALRGQLDVSVERIARLRAKARR